MSEPTQTPAPDVDDEDDDRPWERPGCQRLDCEPHRAEIVYPLGSVSILLAVVSLFLGCAGFVAFPLGIIVFLMSRHDLGQMRDGVMDRCGEAQTRSSFRMAYVAVLLSVIPVILWAIIMLSWIF